MGRRNRPSILIIDDEANFRESLQLALEDSYDIKTASNIQGAVKAVKENTPDAVLLDVRLPDGEGTDLLRELNKLSPVPVTIVMTAYATLDNAVKALKEGAADYFVKPFDIEKLKRELDIYLENRSLKKKLTDLDRELQKIAPPFTTSGQGKMKEVVEKARMIAPHDIPVLVKGETGTGKEKLAKWIHLLSGREGEMVAINCAALPKDIIESELFGYAKGAFSGAVSNKEGLIEKAEGGTLFLDEVGEIPEGVQAKFLRVLEEGVYYKLGETVERRASFRLISATNRDFSASGKFRQDLYYRINGIALELPPLRERKEDIPLLISTFIEEADLSYNKTVRNILPKSLDLLLHHGWPGNIRELKWCISRAVALSSSEIIKIDESMLDSASGVPFRHENDDLSEVSFKEAMERLERNYIEHALAITHDNKTEAAEYLGISVRTLHYKLRKYSL
ncbi:MAG: sigma-54 dependent transcriptional regulator [Nitrospirota bacterium]